MVRLRSGKENPALSDTYNPTPHDAHVILFHVSHVVVCFGGMNDDHVTRGDASLFLQEPVSGRVCLAQLRRDDFEEIAADARDAIVETERDDGRVAEGEFDAEAVDQRRETRFEV